MFKIKMGLSMAVVGVADQFMIMMAIVMLFTVLSISYSRNLVLGLLAGISWLVSGLANFAVGDKTSGLTGSLSWLFIGIGIIFVVRIVYYSTRTMHDKRWETEWQ